MARPSRYESSTLWIATGLKKRARETNVSISAVSRWAINSEIARLKKGGKKSCNHIKDTERCSVWLLRGSRDKATELGVNIPRSVSARLRKELSRVEFALSRGRPNRRTSCRDKGTSVISFVNRRSRKVPKRSGCSNVSNTRSRKRYKDELAGKEKPIELYTVGEAIKRAALDSI